MRHIRKTIAVFYRGKQIKMKSYILPKLMALTVLFMAGVFISCSGKKQDFAEVGADRVKISEQTHSVTVINGTGGTAAKIVITPKEASKANPVRVYTNLLQRGDAKSFDLPPDTSYRIELFDTDGHRYAKKSSAPADDADEYLWLTDDWQQVVLTDADYRMQGAGNLLKKFFSRSKSVILEESATCPVIIVNETGRAIKRISICRDDATEDTAAVELPKGGRMTLDIARNGSYTSSLGDGNAKSEKLFVQTGLSFADSTHQTVRFTPDSLSNASKKSKD